MGAVKKSKLDSSVSPFPRRLRLIGVTKYFFAFLAVSAWAAFGQNAIRTNAGFSTSTLNEGDAVASLVQPLGFTAGFYGRNFTEASVNADGMVTLGLPSASFAYRPLRELTQASITPFWSDAYANANSVRFGRDTVNGRTAFAATWNGIIPFPFTANGPQNVFQLVLIDRADTGAGNFDFEFNYNAIRWECSNNNRGCTAGVGFAQARAGWTSGTGAPAVTAFEIDGSNEASLFLDNNPLNLGLITRSMDAAGVAGRLVFQVRGGTVQNASRAPQISSVNNAASFATNFAPNGFFTIFGSNFTTLQGPWDKFIAGSTLPPSIRSMRVRVNNQDAYISYFSPGQMNVLAPPGNYAGNVTIEVSNGVGPTQRTVLVNRVSPGWFGYQLGATFYPSALYANTTTYVARPGSLGGLDARACKAGDVLTLYATGLGPTATATPLGQVLPGAFPIDNPARVSITLGGQSAPLLFAGMTFAGAFQINFTVPAISGSGDTPLVMEVDGVRTQAASLFCQN